MTVFDQDVLSADDALGQVEVELGRRGGLVVEVPLDATGVNAEALQRSRFNEVGDEIKGRLHFVIAEPESDGDVNVHVKMTSLKSVNDALVVFRRRVEESEHWQTAAFNPAVTAAQPPPLSSPSSRGGDV